jgi:hypothetical protein
MVFEVVERRCRDKLSSVALRYICGTGLGIAGKMIGNHVFGVTEAGYCLLIGAGNSVAWLGKQNVTLKAEVSVIPCISCAREYNCG